MDLERNFNAKMLKNKILWRFSLKTQLEKKLILCRLTDIKIAWINPCF